jgi:hypothetical protein
MKIQKRICSTKRHTIGYVVDGQRMTRGQVVKLARRGQIDGVVAKHNKEYGWFISAKPSSDRQLYGLISVVENKPAKKAAKK